MQVLAGKDAIGNQAVGISSNTASTHGCWPPEATVGAATQSEAPAAEAAPSAAPSIPAAPAARNIPAAIKDSWLLTSAFGAQQPAKLSKGGDNSTGSKRLHAKETPAGTDNDCNEAVNAGHPSPAAETQAPAAIPNASRDQQRAAVKAALKQLLFGSQPILAASAQATGDLAAVGLLAQRGESHSHEPVLTQLLQALMARRGQKTELLQGLLREAVGGGAAVPEPMMNPWQQQWPNQSSSASGMNAGHGLNMHGGDRLTPHSATKSIGKGATNAKSLLRRRRKGWDDTPAQPVPRHLLRKFASGITGTANVSQPRQPGKQIVEASKAPAANKVHAGPAVTTGKQYGMNCVRKARCIHLQCLLL